MAKIYACGEVLVEIMRPEPDQPLGAAGSFLGPYPSGAPAIFIDSAARLGHQTKMWAGVGGDRFGDCIVGRLEADGVDCSSVVRSDKSTAVAFVAYDDEGEREFIFHLRDTAADDFVFEADGEVPDCFHVMGCSLMSGGRLKSGIEQAVEHYCSKGAKISFDPNLRPELLCGRSFSDVAGFVMERCNIFLPGVQELMLAVYGGMSPEAGSKVSAADIDEAVRKLFDDYPSMDIVNVKLGSDGCSVYSRGELRVDVPVYDITSVEPLRDPTGAGDTFDAAFVGALLDGRSAGEAGALASKAGALNVVSFGPMEADLSRMSERILPCDGSLPEGC